MSEYHCPSIIDFFDPHDFEHIQAYSMLVDCGMWPQDFVPDGTIFPIGWQCELAFKITDAWMEHMLAQMRE